MVLSMLPACANIGALEKIKAIHGYIIRSGFELHVYVGSAVVDMYCKCGSVMDAHQMFDKMPEKNLVTLRVIPKMDMEKKPLDSFTKWNRQV